MAEQMRPPNEELNIDDDYDNNIFINASDGLSIQHPILSAYNNNNNNANDDDDDDDVDDGNNENSDRDSDSDRNNSFDNLPTSLIVSNIDWDVFEYDDLKREIEDLFTDISNNVTFQWFKSFKRLRVNYSSPLATMAACARIRDYQTAKSCITAHLSRPKTTVTNKNLQLPAPYKQFLISPPASPPAGWEPRAENEPLVNHDLLAALANLSPGASHELHPPSMKHPAIIVHTVATDDPTTTVLHKSQRSSLNFNDGDDMDDLDDDDLDKKCS